MLLSYSRSNGRSHKEKMIEASQREHSIERKKDQMHDETYCRRDGLSE